MAQKIVGIDLGTYSLKAVVLESTFRGWELVSFHEMRNSPVEPLPPPLPDTEPEPVPPTPAEEETTESTAPTEPADKIKPEHERLRSFLSTYGAKWDILSSSLGGDQVSYKITGLPFSDPRQIDSTLPFALEDQLPFSLQDHAWDWQFLQKSLLGHHGVLVAAADSDRMKDHLAAFKYAGKEPKQVTPEPCALEGLFNHLAPEVQRTGCVAYLDIGHRKTNLAIFQDGQLAFVRSLRFGGEFITDSISKALQISLESAEQLKIQEGRISPHVLTPSISTDETPLTEPEDSVVSSQETLLESTIRKSCDKLIHLLRLSLQAFKALSHADISSVSLTGGCARLRGIDQYLSEHLGQPVALLHYLKNQPHPADDPASAEPEMAIGMGLALNTIGKGRKKRINFRRGAFAFKEEIEYWRGKVAQIALSLMVVLFFFSVNLWAQFSVLSQEEKKLSEEIAKSCKTILGRDVSDAKICISQMMEAIGEGSSGSAASKLRPDFSVLSLWDEMVSRITGTGLDVTIEDIEVSDKKIKVNKGEADAIPTVGTVVENLKDYKCFHNIAQGPTRSNVQGDRIQFSLTIAVDCSTKKGKETPGKEPGSKDAKDTKDSAKEGKDSKDKETPAKEKEEP